ncbi:MAG: dTDP-glucose 4,6-dehydratase [Candidatus Omnitrophica bacterium]|nr:dTDP-glucose 4,6-dehydratase [Candidatus Omnitrophota bacterium]
MKAKIFVTGGAGFIGSEFVRQNASKYQIIVLDKLTYAADQKRLKDVSKYIKFYKTDIADVKKLENTFKKEKPTYVIHFAAETHVDRSISDSRPFVTANVVGTQNLVDVSRKYNIKRFIHISTDEVYGDTTSRSSRFTETAPLKPNNPYSATKAAGELIVRAAIRTYHFPAIIIRPANNYGPWQYPEKLVPMVILRAMKGKRIPVYGRGKQIREWLHVSDCARGIKKIFTNGKIGEIFNIGSYAERNNLMTVRTILKSMNKPKNLIQFIKDRPGHDFRYCVDDSKLRKLGWSPQVRFETGMKETISWYEQHSDWLDKKSDLLQKYWAVVYRNKGK